MKELFKVMRAVSFYRDKKDQMNANAYMLQLVQVYIIIERKEKFFVQIVTPERGTEFDNQIIFEASKATAEENFRKMVMAMRYMIRPEHEEWTHGDPIEQVLNRRKE